MAYNLRSRAASPVPPDDRSADGSQHGSQASLPPLESQHGSPVASQPASPRSAAHPAGTGEAERLTQANRAMFKLYLDELIADGTIQVTGTPPPNGPDLSAAHGTDASAFTKRKEMFKLPTFDGEYKDLKDVKVFCQRVRHYMEIHGVTGRKAVLCLYACFRPNTPAGVWFAKVVNTFDNLAEFETAFRARFKLSKAEVTRVTTELQDYRQLPTESVSAYYTKLTSMYDDLELLDITHNEQQRFAKFLSGLDPMVRTQCATAMEAIPDCTLEKLLSVAMNVEASMRDGRGRPGRPSGPALNAMQVQNRCNYCKQTGHVWDDCPKIAKKKENGTWVERN